MDSPSLLWDADISHLKFVFRRAITQVVEAVLASNSCQIQGSQLEEAANAICDEIACRANYRSKQLHLNLKWNEEQRKLLGQEVQRLRGCEELAADLERANAKLLKENQQVREVQQLRLDKVQLSAENVAQSEVVRDLEGVRSSLQQRNASLVEELQKAQAVGANAESLAESNERLKEQLKKTAARARMADGFDKSNAYLREQIKTLKKERIALQAGRPRSLSPDSRETSPVHANSRSSSPKKDRSMACQLSKESPKSQHALDAEIDRFGFLANTSAADDAIRPAPAQPEPPAPVGVVLGRTKAAVPSVKKNADKILRERAQLAQTLAHRSR